MRIRASTVWRGAAVSYVANIEPYLGGFNSRISKISPAGVRTTVADNLPSSQTTPALGSLVSGVADVAFIGDTLHGIEAGAGEIVRITVP